MNERTSNRMETVTAPENPAREQNVTLVLIVLLLVMRIPITLIVNYTFSTTLPWLIEILEAITYVLLCVLLWINRGMLDTFNISRISVWAFIVSATVLRFKFLAVTPIFWVVGLSVLWLLARRELITNATAQQDSLWAFRGILLGAILAIIISYSMHSFDPSNTVVQGQRPSLGFGIGSFLYELTHAAVPEELIFRGFLWGYLRLKAWPEKSILGTQAALFWLAHLNYLWKPYTFWIAVPLMSIGLGLIVMRSRSTSSSMFMHAMYNTMRFFI